MQATTPQITTLELIPYILPLVIIAVVGSYLVIKHNNALPMPDEDEHEEDDDYNNG